MGDIVKQLRANADYWAKNNGDGTVRMLTAADDEIAIARRRIAELEERTGQLADRLKDVHAAQAEPCHLLADLLDHVVGRDWTAVAPFEPWKAAIAYARRRPEATDA